MITKEIDTVVRVEIPMKIHLGSRHPTRSGLYGVFIRGLDERNPKGTTFHQTWFSTVHNQWFNTDGNRKSMSGLNERLDIVAWAECPNIVPLAGDFAIMQLKQLMDNKER